MRVAVAQMEPKLAEKERNLDACLARLDEAVAAGAELLVLPECAIPGYMFESAEEALPCAEEIPGPSVAAHDERPSEPVDESVATAVGLARLVGIEHQGSPRQRGFAVPQTAEKRRIQPELVPRARQEDVRGQAEAAADVGREGVARIFGSPADLEDR